MSANISEEELALLRAVCSHPEDDAPRLVMADWLEENAGTLPCPKCSGEGCTAHSIATNGPCRDVSDGRAERADFIRVQCELARFDTFSPDHRKEFNELARQNLSKRMTRLERGESESIKIARAIEEGGRLYARRRDALRERERELWKTNAYDWVPNLVGDGAQLAVSSLGDGNCEAVMFSPTASLHLGFRRGFVDEVRCDWRTWAGGPCRRCGWLDDAVSGREPAHTRPERWTWFGPHPIARQETDEARLEGSIWEQLPHVDYPSREAAVAALTQTIGRIRRGCPACSGTGRTPGVWEAVYWSPRDGRTVACPECEGVGNRVHTTCCTNGHVPRPMPKSAQPLTELVLRTVPPVTDVLALAERHGIRMHLAQRHIDAADSAGLGRLLNEVFEAEWPGLTVRFQPRGET